MIRALQAAQDWLNACAKECLDEWRTDDREAEALYYGHLRSLNETWMSDIQRRQMIGVAWEIAAVVAMLLMFAGLAFLRG
jgi:hypothetical protein